MCYNVVLDKFQFFRDGYLWVFGKFRSKVSLDPNYYQYKTQTYAHKCVKKEFRIILDLPRRVPVGFKNFFLQFFSVLNFCKIFSKYLLNVQI